MNSPRTTVVITAWDEPYAGLLGEAARSAASQDPRPSILVVDNASTVPLQDVPGANVVESPNRLTRGAVRNLGLRHVSTEFVLFLDADDLLAPGVVSCLESELDGDATLVACSTMVLEGVYGRSEALKRHSVPKRFVPALSRARRTFAFANSIWPLFSTHGTLIRVEAIRECAYADRDQGEDWPLGLSLAIRGLRVIDKPGIVYRRPADAPALRTDPSSLGAVAGAVRARLRADPKTPRWLRIALPLVWLGQQLAIRGLRPLVQQLRN